MEKKIRKKEVTAMTGIPRDPVMLLSYINTQLRDFLSQPRRALQRPFPGSGNPG